MVLVMNVLSIVVFMITSLIILSQLLLPLGPNICLFVIILVSANAIIIIYL